MNRSVGRFSRNSVTAGGLKSREGFAMFLALGALVIIGVLIAASSYISLQETRLGQNSLVETRAFSAAEYGLNKIQSDWDLTPNLKMANGTSFDTSYALGKDTVTVRYTRLNNETFWIVAEGRSYAGPYAAGSRTAVKRVGAVLRLRIPSIRAQGAITAGGNVTVRGGADVVGYDTDPPNWAECAGRPDTNKAGIVVPPGNTVTTSGSSTVTGEPNPPGWRTDPLAADQNTYIRYGDETWNTLVAQANITTAGGTIGNQVQPTAVNGVCNKADPFNWGEPHRFPNDPLAVTACNNYFPIIYSSGNITLDGDGRGQGILLVNGSIQINGHFEWYGIIIVSNDIVRGNGSAQVYGAVMARNEVKADESILSGTTTYSYSGCAIERAMRGSAQVVQAKERAWTELY